MEPDGRGDHGPPRIEEGGGRKRGRAADDDETTVSERLVAPRTPATQFIEAWTGHGAPQLSPIQRAAADDRDYQLAFQVRRAADVLVLDVQQGAGQRGWDTSSRGDVDRVMLLDAAGQVGAWRADCPAATLTNYPKLGVASFSDAASATPRKREALLVILLEEWTAWAAMRPGARVVVACRAGHERSSAVMLLAHAALAHVLLVGDARAEVLAADRDLARTLEPRRDTWGIGVLALMDTLESMLHVARAQLRPRPLTFHCATCRAETLAYKGWARRDAFYCETCIEA